jgi:uncharacterized membrane protein
MKPERMNAFTDGVIAILITILVLELRPPAGDRLSDILSEKARLLAYLLSFVFVAIYWVNHHHLMQVVHRIDGRTLWANIHLLFWLSLTPIAGPGRHVCNRAARLRGRVHAADPVSPRHARARLNACAGHRQ